MIQVDLPMPEACDVCPMNYDFCYCRAINDEAWEKYGDDWNNNVCERRDHPDYCPLNPIRPTWQQGKAYCGQCGKRIPLKIKANYCHKCGREINWLP